VPGRTFALHLGADAPASQVRIAQFVIAGWTGRDAAAVEAHIRELEALGIKRPATCPIFYRVAVARITLDDSIEVSGNESSGEAELTLMQCGGRLWLGVGSDHTDRSVETYGVTVSKQMCDKPLGATFWPVDEVRAHWDELLLRSFINENGRLTLYQEGTAAEFRDPEDLVQRYSGASSLAEGTLMFCGTLAAKGGVRSAEQFVFELEDPVLERRIRHQYRCVPMPVAG
jgi:Protein of unknown function (DUF2848)